MGLHACRLHSMPTASLPTRSSALLSWQFGKGGTASYIPDPGRSVRCERAKGWPRPTSRFISCRCAAIRMGAASLSGRARLSDACLPATPRKPWVDPARRRPIHLPTRLIDPRYLSAAEDVDTLARRDRDRTADRRPRSAFAPYRGDELWPGGAVQSRDALRCGGHATWSRDDLPPGRDVPDGRR